MTENYLNGSVMTKIYLGKQQLRRFFRDDTNIENSRKGNVRDKDTLRNINISFISRAPSYDQHLPRLPLCSRALVRYDGKLH